MCLLDLKTYVGVFDIWREFNRYIRYLSRLSQRPFSSDRASKFVPNGWRSWRCFCFAYCTLCLSAIFSTIFWNSPPQSLDRLIMFTHQQLLVNHAPLTDVCRCHQLQYAIVQWHKDAGNSMWSLITLRWILLHLPWLLARSTSTLPHMTQAPIVWHWSALTPSWPALWMTHSAALTPGVVLCQQMSQRISKAFTSREELYRIVWLKLYKFIMMIVNCFHFCLRTGYYDSGRVCLLRAYLKNHTSKFHQIFYACCLWPWLSPSLMALQYVVYLEFCRRCHISHNWLWNWVCARPLWGRADEVSQILWNQQSHFPQSHWMWRYSYMACIIAAVQL